MPIPCLEADEQITVLELDDFRPAAEPSESLKVFWRVQRWRNQNLAIFLKILGRCRATCQHPKNHDLYNDVPGRVITDESMILLTVCRERTKEMQVRKPAFLLQKIATGMNNY